MILKGKFLLGLAQAFLFNRDGNFREKKKIILLA